jgi:hypothetical protein
MFLITIKLVFKKGFLDELQYFDFFEAFPSVFRQLKTIEDRIALRATRWRQETMPNPLSIASNRRNGTGGADLIWKF